MASAVRVSDRLSTLFAQVNRTALICAVYTKHYFAAFHQLALFVDIFLGFFLPSVNGIEQFWNEASTVCRVNLNNDFFFHAYAPF